MYVVSGFSRTWGRSVGLVTAIAMRADRHVMELYTNAPPHWPKVTDRGQHYCVFLLASGSAESAAAFAGAKEFIEADGTTRAVYYCPEPRADAAPRNPFGPFRTRYVAPDSPRRECYDHSGTAGTFSCSNCGLSSTTP